MERRPPIVTRTYTRCAYTTLFRSAQAHVVEPALGGQDRGDLYEHLRLKLGEVFEIATHPSRRGVLGEPAGGEHEREHVGVLLRWCRVHRVVVADIFQPGDRKSTRLNSSP